MTSTADKIKVWENALAKNKKELRKHRYPSKDYLFYEKLIGSIEIRLEKLYSQRAIEKASLQLNIYSFNQEAI